MASRRRVVVLLVALALAALASGCSLFSGDYPSRACRSTQDCFAAQGEICDVTRHECVTRADAAPMSDAEVSDAL